MAATAPNEAEGGTPTRSESSHRNAEEEDPMAALCTGLSELDRLRQEMALSFASLDLVHARMQSAVQHIRTGAEVDQLAGGELSPGRPSGLNQLSQPWDSPPVAGEEPSVRASETGAASVVKLQERGSRKNSTRSSFYGTQGSANLNQMLPLRRGYEQTEEQEANAVMEDEGVGSLDISQLISGGSGDFKLSSHNPRCIIGPHSSIRLLLDASSLVVLGFDLFVIPVVLAWDIAMEGWLLSAAFVSLTFWTIDMIAAFRTAIYVRGVLVTSQRAIAKKYVKTWFLPDLLVVLGDGVSTVLNLIISTSVTPQTKMLRFVKIGRALRLAGIMKLRRFSDVVERIVDHRLPAGTEMFTSIFKLFCLILWMNHVVSCAWYAIGSQIPADETDTGLRWTDELVGPNTDQTYLNSGKYAYFSAFHWSLCQMTPGSLQINPLNVVERMFCIACLLVGMIFFSSLVSSVSAKLTEYRISQEKRVNIIKQLRRFLMQKRVCHDVCVSVLKQLEDRMAQRAQPLVKDLQGLPLLSHSMQAMLFSEIFSPYLLRCPLWRWWGEVDTPSAHRFYHAATTFVLLKPGDALFHGWAEAHSAYIVSSGELHYTEVGVHEVEHVGEGAWLSEAALWTQWIHAGKAEAPKTAEVVAVSAERMMEGLKQAPVYVFEMFADYARAFHASLTSLASCAPEGAVVNDLAHPARAFQEIFPSMTFASQRLMGLVAVEVLRERSFLFMPHTGALDRLGDEVRSGKCLLTLDEAGDVERMVSVVTLRLVSSDGLLLVQLGTWTEDRISPCCMLPGTKQLPRERSADAIRRLLRAELLPLAYKVSLAGCETEEETSVSQHQSGARTHYRVTIHQARLEARSKQLGLVTKSRPVYESESSGGSGIVLRRTFSAEPGFHLSEVIVLTDGEKVLLYTWMSPQKFESLRQARASERLLLSQLSSIGVSDEEVDRASELFHRASRQDDRAPVFSTII